MDYAGIAALIMAGIATVTAIGTALLGAWRWAKAQAKAEYMREQSASTIKELEADNAELKTENADLKTENARLWAMIPEHREVTS